MTTGDRFLAQILESSAVGFAGLAASLLLERRPEIARRYEPSGFAGWKGQLQRWLLDLSAALDAGEPKLFEARVLWTRKAFAAREVPVEDLQAALEALRDTLGERLPEDSSHAVVQVVERAIAAVGDPGAGAPAVAEPAIGQDTLAYLEKILSGSPREAIELVLGAVGDGVSVHDAYLHILIPAQREAGRLWHAGDLSVAEEHLVTATTQRAMALLAGQASAASPKGKTVLLACVAGDAHDVGLRAIADFFEIAGWRTINIGADAPHDEIARSVTYFDADLVVLSATLDPHVKAVTRTIERIRDLDGRKVKIIVGGPAFESVPDLWSKIGADGYAARLEDAEPLGSRLTL